MTPKKTKPKRVAPQSIMISTKSIPYPKTKVERPSWDDMDNDITRNEEESTIKVYAASIGGCHVKCTQCGKQFWKTPEWVYMLGSKNTHRYFCSYSCSRAYEKAHYRIKSKMKGV